MNRRFVRGLLLAALLVLLCTQVFAAQETLAALRLCLLYTSPSPRD